MPGEIQVEPRPNRSKQKLANGEVVVSLQFPVRPAHSGDAYQRFTPRTEMDIAVVGVAAAVELDESGENFVSARVALGAVAPVPVRAKAAEALLQGRTLSKELAEQAGEQAAWECTPISDIRSSAEYRKEMVRVLTKRSLLNAATGKRPLAWTERRLKRY